MCLVKKKLQLAICFPKSSTVANKEAKRRPRKPRHFLGFGFISSNSNPPASEPLQRANDSLDGVMLVTGWLSRWMLHPSFLTVFFSKTYCWWKKSPISCWIIRPMFPMIHLCTPLKNERMSPENQESWKMHFPTEIVTFVSFFRGCICICRSPEMVHPNVTRNSVCKKEKRSFVLISKEELDAGIDFRRSSMPPTWTQAGGQFVQVVPQGSQGTFSKIWVSFLLGSWVGIDVSGKPRWICFQWELLRIGLDMPPSNQSKHLSYEEKNHLHPSQF